MASAIMNWAAVTNRRLHRAAIHNNIGKIETRATSSHGAPGMKIKSELAAAKINRAAVPSTDFLRDGGSRAVVMRPITKGATAMIRKLKSGKYRLYSRKVDEKSGRRRNLGTFDTREAAEKHEREVQYFKRH